MLAAGDFDQSFGGGFIELPVNNIFEAKTQVVAGEQKLVRLNAGGAGSLTRYTENGNIDNAFNTAFSANFANLPPSNRVNGTPFLGFTRFAIQGDKLLVAGQFTSSFNVGVVRYHSDGTLDTSFGSNGVLNTGIPLNGAMASSPNDVPALEIETQGDNVLVAVSARPVGGNSTAYDSQVVVARYTSTGAVDTSFASQGQLVFHTPGNADWVTGVRVDDNAAVIAVMSSDGNTLEEFPSSLIRIDGDQLDSQFGTNGVLQISPRSNWAMQDDRTLIETSIFYPNNPNTESDDEYVQTLEMYDSAGSLDPDFNAPSIDFGPWATAFQPDGGIVLLKDDTLLRLLPNGAIDTSFGTNGIVQVNNGFSQVDYVYPHPNKGFTLQPDGKIVLTSIWQEPEMVWSITRLIDNDDGIENAVDTLPLEPSEAFSDGTTSGQIIERGDQFLTIIDSPNPTRGVRISANAAGGSTPAEIDVEGITFFLDPGDSVTVTRGSVILNVDQGTIDVNFASEGGSTVATARLSTGEQLTFEPETVTFTAAPTETSVEVTLLDATGQIVATADLSDGNGLTYEPETVTFTAVPTNNETPLEVTLIDEAGQVVATADLTAGNGLTYEPETTTFTAASTNDQPVEVVLIGENGQEAVATLSAENQITFEPESFTFTAPETNSEPVLVVVDGAVLEVSPGDTEVVRSVIVNIAPESLTLDSNGMLTVFIYGAADFSTANIDITTVRFAGALATQSSLLDSNNDGLLDLQLKFRTQDTTLLDIYQQLLLDDADLDGILDSSRQIAEVSVTGQTLDDELFTGSDDLTLSLSGRSLRQLLDDLFG